MAHQQWRLVHDAVIPYGAAGVHYVVHVRGFEAGSDVDPIVMLGQFGEHVGPSITNSAAEAAAAAQAALYPCGRTLRFVVVRPDSPSILGVVPRFNEVTFDHRRRHGRVRRWLAHTESERRGRWLATFTIATPEGISRHVFPPTAPEWPWTFHGPSFSTDLDIDWGQDGADALYTYLHTTPLVRPARVGIPALLGTCSFEVWPKDLYIPALVGGPQAAEVADQRRATCDRHFAALTGLIDSFTDAPPGSFMEEGHTPNTDT
jgi:hypothetical protein